MARASGTKERPGVTPLPLFGPGPGRGGPMAIFGQQARAEDVRGVMLRLWSYLRRYRGRLIGVALLVIATSGLGVINPYLTQVAIDRCITPRRLDLLAGVAALMLVLAVLNSAGTWLQSVMMIRLSQDTLRDIRRGLFGHLQLLPLRFFDSRPHGEIMSSLTNDTEAVNSALAQTLAQLVGSVLSIIFTAAAMFIFNWWLALVVLATTPLAIGIAHWVATASRQRFRQRQSDLAALNGMIEETISGQRVVKAFAQEERITEQFDQFNRRLRSSATAAGIVGGVMGPTNNFARNISFAVLVAAGGWLVLHRYATVGTLAAFISYAQNFMRPLNMLAMLWATVQTAIAGAERVFRLIDQPAEPPDAPEAAPLGQVEGEVEFAEVTFGYSPDQPVLREVSFTAPAGHTIALVGPTGAGKTTIINLLSRFYDVDSGAIRLDGHDLRELRREELRQALGIVLQDTVLFADTVRENIRYGRLDATDAEIEEAARLANALGFIRRLPHGFDTVLSEAAGTLSQGQRQLLSIARAILADPAVLVLDEATSSVDTRTELQIQEAMLRLMEGRTAFVIAHRLSTIRRAEMILVIDGGRIVERGNHQELMAARGHYWRLHNLQFGGEGRTAEMENRKWEGADGVGDGGRDTAGDGERQARRLRSQ